MSIDFDVTKHRLTKDGRPHVAGAGRWYMPLKPGESNSPEVIEAYMGLHAPRAEKIKPMPVGMVADQSIVSPDLDQWGMVHKVEERTAKLVVSQDEIQKALEAEDQGDLVHYQYLDRKFNQWLVGKYSLAEMMNKLYSYCNSKGATITLKHEDVDCRTINVVNAFGASTCINVKQMPATIEREIKRICTIGKPYAWEDPGRDAPGEFKHGLMA